MKRFHLSVSLMLFASCLGLHAQTEAIYERGATYLENTMPLSPQPALIINQLADKDQIVDQILTNWSTFFISHI